MMENTLKEAFDAIEKSSEMVGCTGCRKKIEWKNALWRIIPGLPLPNPFCDESCMYNYISSQIKHHEDILRELNHFDPRARRCPNCGKEVIRYVRRDEVVRAHSMNHFYNKKFVGMAVHKEIIGAKGESIPERFCDLTEEDWRSIFDRRMGHPLDQEEDQDASKS